MSCIDHLSELEALRLQVADLTRELAERDRSAQDLREKSELLCAIVNGTATETGEEFFTALVRQLTSLLHIEYAVIGEVQGDHTKKIRTLAVSAGGVIVDNFEYELIHTPCATALAQSCTCFTQNVRETFPQFQRLADLGAESYCAVSIRAKDGADLGLLVVMDTKPLENSDYVQSLLAVFAPRVAAEFERKRVEQERARALAEIRNVIETVPDIMFTLDTHGNMVKWNHRVEVVTGYSPDELLNMPALAFVPPEEHVPTAAAIERAFTEGYAELEGHLLTKEYRAIPYHWTGALLKNSHGEPIGITGVGRDVSAKRRAEEDRQKALTLLMNVINNTPDLIFVKDRDLRTVLCNNAFAQASGKPQESLLGHTDVENGWGPELVYGNPDKGIRGFELDDREALSGKVMRIPSEPINVGSEVRMFDTHKVPLRSDTGEVIGVLGIARDITERKRLDEALRVSEERWHLAVRGSNDGIWDWDIQSGTVFFSPRWKEMRGFGEHEITGHVEEWQRRIHPDDLDRVLQSLDAYVAKQAPVYCEEYRTQRKDGSYMWILNRGLALWADDGTPLRIVGSESDITEHKLALLRLAEQESLLRAILDTEPECVNRVADDGTILQMNKAGLCFIESDSFEPVAGRSVYDLVAPEFLEPYRRMHEAVIRGASQRLEFQIIGLKGTRRWMETHAVPLRNPIDHRMEHLAITRDITDRKQAEEALRASEERFHAAFRHATVGMGLIDLTNRIVEANQAFSDITGYSEAELKTLTFLDITHPDDRPATRALQQNAVKGKRESFEVEKRYIRKNGAIVWVHVSVGAIHDASGHVTHTIGLITDITERKRSEEALRESEAQFRALAESTTDWLWEIDEQGRYTYCSPKIRDLLGYEPDEALGKTPFDFMPEEEARRVAGVFGPIAAARLPFAGIENTNRHKNGRLVILECRGTPIIDDNGVFGGYRGFDQDITERKQAERALQDRERALARFKATLDQTHDCVFMFAPDTLRFIYCNRGAVEQVGYSEVELSAMTPLDIKPEFTERSFREILQPLQDGSKVSHVFETIHRHKDGHDVAVEVSVQLVREEGQEGRFVAVVRDITERKQAEQALRESEEKFRTIVEASPIGIFMIDPSGSVTYGNAADLRMTGLSWEDTLGTRWIKAIHPEDRVQVLADWQAAMQQGKSYVGTGRYLHEDGTIVWWDVQTVAVRVSGRLLGHVGMVVDITVRKQAEDALRASEERLRLSLEAASQGIYDLNVQTGEALVSSGYASMLGYDPATFHETTDAWIERLHPDDRERVADYYRAYVAGEIPEYRVEFRQRTYGGDWRWVLSLGRIVERDARGEPLRMLGTHTDITERKRVEESLRISEERFQIVARATNEAIWDWDLNTDEVEWNQGFQDLFGYKSEDIEPSAQSWTSRLHPDDRGRVIAEIHAAIGSGKQFWCDEYRFLRADGSHAHIFDRGYIIHDSAAKPIRMIGSMQDITERKQAEEALRASEERFELAVRGSNTAIWDWDLRTNKTYFSPLWKSMLGYGEHELKDEFFEWEERLHPDDRDRSSATVRAYLNGTNPQYELEHRLRHKDGSYRWILARGVSICDTEGKPYRMSGSHIDITELKETQETLAQRERQLQTVLDALPLGVWFTDQAGRLLLANPAARQIWSGIRQVGIETGANAAGWWEAMGPSRELHRWALSQALTKGIPSLHETLDLECLDGTKKTIRNSTVPVRDEAGLVVGALVLNEDVTSLRQAQEALRLTQFSVDHAVEAFFWIDHQGNILNVNESACRMLERSREELITMTVHDIDPNFPPELWPTHWAELKQKGSITFETKLWSQPGHVIATEVTVNYLHYDGHEYNCAIMRDIGERKRAEEALRRSEARLRTITDAVPGAVYQYELSADGTQRFLFLSQGIQGLFGVTSAEGENDFSSIWNRILPGEVEDFWASIRESSEILSPWKHEFRILHADGTTRWIRGNSIPESPRNDGSILWNGILVDITERKQAEETLRLAKFSMDRAADAVYWIDPQAKVLYVNEAGSFMLGYSKDELCAMTVHDLNPAFEADKWPEFWEETKRRGTMVIETVHRSKNGRLIPVEVSANYLSHEGKEYHCAFVRDITERQQAEEKLRESHAFIRQIIDTNPNLIFVKDREGRFTLANKAVADTYGTTVENLIGKTDADFNANQEEVVSFRQNDLEVMDTLQELFLSEEMITDSMGRTRWLQTVKRPILDHEGRAIMVLGSSTDITERKRMEETLRQREHDLRAALEGRERISQDLHDGILQSLFAVGLALESVKLTMSARNLKTSRASLNQAINQLNDVMREIRNFIAGLGSDLLKGRDLPAALQHMLETLTENQATRVRLAVEDRAAKALSTEQSSHLLRVIQEAVGNCIKHGRAQEARVSLKMLKQGVRLSIRDDGRGFNLSAAKGAGHGLTNMAARAQKIGGRLTILSKVNEGTRVVLDLPNEAVLAFH